jgi:hypothetical protein
VNHLDKIINEKIKNVNSFYGYNQKILIIFRKPYTGKTRAGMLYYKLGSNALNALIIGFVAMALYGLFLL